MASAAVLETPLIAEDSAISSFYYPSFLSELLGLEVPVRKHFLPHLDPTTLSHLEMVNRECLSRVRAHGYWKDVIVAAVKLYRPEIGLLDRYDESVCELISTSHDAMFHRRLWSRLCHDHVKINENFNRNRYLQSLLVVYHLGQQKLVPLFKVDPSHRFVFTAASDSPEVTVTNIKRKKLYFITKSQYALNLYGENPGKVTCLEINGDLLFVGCNNGTVAVWNWKTARHINQVAHRLGILALKARHRRLMVGCRDHTASLWRFSRPTAPASMRATFRVTRGLIRAVDFNATHAVIVSDNTVGVWYLENETQLRTLPGNTVTCMSLHRNLLIVGSIDRSVKLWDVVSGKCLKVLEECAAEVTCLTTDWKEKLFTGDRSGNVRVWDLKKITDVGSNVVTTVITDLKLKGSIIQSLSFDGVSLFCTMKESDSVNHKKLAIKILDYASPLEDVGRFSIAEKCSIS